MATGQGDLNAQTIEIGDDQCASSHIGPVEQDPHIQDLSHRPIALCHLAIGGRVDKGKVPAGATASPTLITPVELEVVIAVEAVVDTLLPKPLSSD